MCLLDKKKYIGESDQSQYMGELRQVNFRKKTFACTYLLEKKKYIC